MKNSNLIIGSSGEQVKGYKSILSPEAIREGFSVRAPDDHILELLKDQKVIARFSQAGVEVDNILKEVEAGKYRN